MPHICGTKGDELNQRFIISNFHLIYVSALQMETVRQFIYMEITPRSCDNMVLYDTMWLSKLDLTQQYGPLWDI